MTFGGALSRCRFALLRRQQQLRYLCLERYNCSNAQTLLVGRCRQLSASSHFSANQNSSSPTAASADAEPPLGRVFDCKPVKMVLEAGKMYGWCTCGHSKKQPMCDGAHKSLNQSPEFDQSKPPFHPHKFKVDEQKEAVLCNCKQTSNRPFCDGSHKQQWIQDAVK